MNEPNTVLITPSGDIRKIDKERKVIIWFRCRNFDVNIAKLIENKKNILASIVEEHLDREDFNQRFI